MKKIYINIWKPTWLRSLLSYHFDKFCQTAVCICLWHADEQQDCGKNNNLSRETERQQLKRGPCSMLPTDIHRNGKQEVKLKWRFLVREVNSHTSTLIVSSTVDAVVKSSHVYRSGRIKLCPFNFLHMGFKSSWSSITGDVRLLIKCDDSVCLQHHSSSAADALSRWQIETSQLRKTHGVASAAACAPWPCHVRRRRLKRQCQHQTHFFEMMLGSSYWTRTGQWESHFRQLNFMHAWPRDWSDVPSVSVVVSHL